jgi:hypothetical protein
VDSTSLQVVDIVFLGGWDYIQYLFHTKQLGDLMLNFVLCLIISFCNDFAGHTFLLRIKVVDARMLRINESSRPLVLSSSERSASLDANIKQMREMKAQLLKAPQPDVELIKQIDRHISLLKQYKSFGE